MNLEEELNVLIGAANKVGVKDITVVGRTEIYTSGGIAIFQDFGSPQEAREVPKYEGLALIRPGAPNVVSQIFIGEDGYPTINGVIYCRMLFPTSLETYCRQFEDTHKGPFTYKLRNLVAFSKA